MPYGTKGKPQSPRPPKPPSQHLTSKKFDVTLITSNGAKRTEITQDLLFGLINSINENGKEIAHTNRGSYEVTGVVIGDVKGKVLIL